MMNHDETSKFGLADFQCAMAAMGKKLYIFPWSSSSMGDEKLGEASALRRDVGKEEPPGVLSSAGSKEISFRASKCHEFHGCLESTCSGEVRGS